jgi:hypothetical protein
VTAVTSEPRPYDLTLSTSAFEYTLGSSSMVFFFFLNHPLQTSRRGCVFDTYTKDAI